MLGEKTGKLSERIQANVLLGLPHRQARLVFLRFAEQSSAKRWLRALHPNLTSSFEQPPPEIARTLALSPSGLATLGVPDDRLRYFPAAFLEGMFARRQRLRDPSWNDDLAANLALSDALLSLYGDDPVALEREVESLRRSDEVSVVACEAGAKLPGDREHFGFVDGIGQPIWKGAGPQDWISATPLEKFLLFNREHDPFLHLGSFLVFRKLGQDVAAFRSFVQGAARSSETADDVASKMVGRRPDGAPLIEGATGDDFDYRNDEEGEAVPTGSHIRRTNPRKDGAPRIVRRGMPYGPPAPDLEEPLAAQTLEVEDRPRGLLFLGLTNEIEHVFEFMQRRWVEDRGHHPLDRRDPLIGRNDGSAASQLRIPGKEGGAPSRTLRGIPRFVTTLGGAYFFLPTLDALRLLADLPWPPLRPVPASN